MLHAVCKKCPLLFGFREPTWEDFAQTTGSTCTVIMSDQDYKVIVPYEGTEDKFNGGQKCDVEEGPCACGAWH